MTAQKTFFIDLKNAHNDILKNLPVKDEISVINGIYAVSYIPNEGAIFLNEFREENQFQFSLVSISFNDSETTFSVPLEFQGITGRTPEEETHFNYNRQILHKPLTLNKKIEPNSTLKIKYCDNLSQYRFKYNIKLILTYIEK